jgi:hypothetical protein
MLSVQDLLSSFKQLAIRIYKKENSTLLLYGSKTWSLTLREEKYLRYMKKCIQEKESNRRMEKLHNQNLYNLSSSPQH